MVKDIFKKEQVIKQLLDATEAEEIKWDVTHNGGVESYTVEYKNTTFFFSSSTKPTEISGYCAHSFIFGVLLKPQLKRMVVIHDLLLLLNSEGCTINSLSTTDTELRKLYYNHLSGLHDKSLEVTNGEFEREFGVSLYDIKQ